MRFSIVVSTFNRHPLLQEALTSIAAQRFSDWEVIVVDDGSKPAVDIEDCERVLGRSAHLVRHESPRGLPAVNNAGLARTRGEIVLYLEDDDLLASEALVLLDQLFMDHPEVDCIFMNVEPFGMNAAGSRENQSKAIAGLLAAACSGSDEGLYFLDDRAFHALLQSVPLAMQRPAARRSAWNIVGKFTEGIPFSKPDWAIRAAVSARLALSKVALQLWRVDDQNYFSRPDRYALGIDAQIAALGTLVVRLQREGEARRAMSLDAKKALARAYLGKAWFARTSEERVDWRALWHSFLWWPRFAPIRLLGTTLLAIIASGSGKAADGGAAHGVRQNSGIDRRDFKQK